MKPDAPLVFLADHLDEIKVDLHEGATGSVRIGDVQIWLSAEQGHTLRYLLGVALGEVRPLPVTQAAAGGGHVTVVDVDPAMQTGARFAVGHPL